MGVPISAAVLSRAVLARTLRRSDYAHQALEMYGGGDDEVRRVRDWKGEGREEAREPEEAWIRGLEGVLSHTGRME